MMLKELNTAICRTPIFGIDDEIFQKWDTLKEKIRDSSPGFYDLIAQNTIEEFSSLPFKTQYTLWKYFNRAKYRPTPFAEFAAITLSSVKTGISKLVIESKMQTSEFTDWSEKDDICKSTAVKLKKSDLLHLNSYCYKVGNEYRFIRFNNQQFELTSINEFPELNELVRICERKVHKSEVYHEMFSIFGLKQQVVQDLITQLLNLQFLNADISPNITGTDYFNRIKYKKQNNKTYTLSERHLREGAVSPEKLTGLPETILFLSKYLPDQPNLHLEKFKESFFKKYEYQEVPLSLAMDPEIGIGYGNLEHQNNKSELIELLITNDDNPQGAIPIQYTELHNFLLKRLVKGGTIDLHHFKGSEPISGLVLPNTFSILLSFYNNRPVVKNAGGCTANALLGRFTLVSKTLENYCGEITNLEKEANPNIIFFDVAYQAEKNIDNVNRRKVLYDYELPVLTWSCHQAPLDFNDLMISIKNSEIILRSKKLGKRLIPRIPSAYNYTRSDLSAYRFLCDIQHQNIKSDINFNFKHFLPELDHYPRVVYKDVIVSPAMWLIPANLYLDKNKSLNDAVIDFKEWLNANHINFHFKSGESDQTLCFDPGSETDLGSFVYYCRNQGKTNIYISEALLSETDCVEDENKKKYVAEYIISFHHKSKIYPEINHTRPSEVLKKTSQNILLPGSDWIYFKIIVHPVKSNLLLDQIHFFIKTIKRDIKKWFFIRYKDGTDHLRLRIQLKESSDGYETIKSLKNRIEQQAFDGLIGDFSIHTYTRETERYGEKRITLVEDFFHNDSILVLLLLKRGYDDICTYGRVIWFIQYLLARTYSLNNCIKFSSMMADNFTAELKLNPSKFKEINKTFKIIKSNIIPPENSKINRIIEKQGILYAVIMQSCDAEEKERVTADLVHMHINRLFTQDQRVHEGIIYHFVLKQFLFLKNLKQTNEHQL